MEVKGGMQMRKPFNTSIEETIQKEFKRNCKLAEPELPMNIVLESLMDGYNKGKIKVTMNVFEVEEKGK